MCGTTEFHATVKLGRAVSRKLLLLVLVDFFKLRIHDLFIGLGLGAAVSSRGAGIRAGR